MREEARKSETILDKNIFGLYGHFNLITVLVMMLAAIIGWQMLGTSKDSEEIMIQLGDMRTELKKEPKVNQLEDLEDRMDDILEEANSQRQRQKTAAANLEKLRKELRQFKNAIEVWMDAQEKMLEQILEAVEQPVVLVKKKRETEF